MLDDDAILNAATPTTTSGVATHATALIKRQQDEIQEKIRLAKSKFSRSYTHIATHDDYDDRMNDEIDEHQHQQQHVGTFADFHK
eukprot:UN08564